MTKFKKCDYCHIDNSSVKKYKTCWSEFGMGTKKHNMLPGKCGVSYTAVDQFYLCDPCFIDLIPEDKVVRGNKVDNDFFEAEIRKKIGLKHRMHAPMEGLRKGAGTPRKKSEMYRHGFAPEEVTKTT